MKRILLVTHLNPFGYTFGAEQRTNLVLKSLLSLGNKVDICYIGQPIECPDVIMSSSKIVYWNNNTEQNLSKYDCLCRKFLLQMFPESKRFSVIVRELMHKNDYDCIVCRYVPYAAMAGLGRYADRLLLDIDDLPEQALQIDFSSKHGLKKVYFDLLRLAYRRDTARWIRQSRASFLPNKLQAIQYNCTYLPNISIMSNEHLCLTGNHNILFVGKMDYGPNVDGVKLFIENNWQSILNIFPDAVFHIAGKGLEQNLIEEWTSKFSSIKYWGFVKNLRSFYEIGDIVICPIYSGAGTNIKIVEAMSMGKVVLVSKNSIKGYEHFLVDGANCLIAENIEDFTYLTTKLFSDSSLVKHISLTALAQAKQRYSFDSFKSVLSKFL